MSGSTPKTIGAIADPFVASGGFVTQKTIELGKGGGEGFKKKVGLDKGEEEDFGEELTPEEERRRQGEAENEERRRIAASKRREELSLSKKFPGRRQSVLTERRQTKTGFSFLSGL